MLKQTAVATMIWTPRFRRWRTARICAYVALGSSSSIPMLHGIQLYGLKYVLKYSGMRWYLLELAFYGIGAGLYAVSLCLSSMLPLVFSRGSDLHPQFRVPERFVPGKFDIWGSSHQIFHIAVVCAMYTHTVGLMQAFTTCRTSSPCKVQATPQGALTLQTS